MKNINLTNVTLCAVACTKVPETIYALKKSMRGITYARAILITHEDLNLEKDGIEVIKIERLDYKGYNHFILYRLKDYIQSDFVLIVQNDGYILHPWRWTNKFLDYDYIGAPWPKNLHFSNTGREIRMGNGGFTFRSKKMLNIMSDLNLPFSDFGTGFFHEDGIICLGYRDLLEEKGIKFAPINIASRFSRERWCSDSKLFTFGFHSNRRNIFKYLYKKLLKKLTK
jgi:Protein of unknown function (DUF5672)